MKIAYAVAGTALVAATGCQLTSTPTSAAPPVTVTAPAATPATVYVTPSSAAPDAGGPARVPFMAQRRLDVAEYMLSAAGLSQALVGPLAAANDPTEYYVCASQPRANTTVPSGTRVALIVEKWECD
jgi:beta-lactam-binding protein with PASTA domain